MTLIKAVARRILGLLDKKGWTCYRLAINSGLTNNCVQKLVGMAYNDVKLSTLTLIADAFNLTLPEFFDDEIFKQVDIFTLEK